MMNPNLRTLALTLLITKMTVARPLPIDAGGIFPGGFSSDTFPSGLTGSNARNDLEGACKAVTVVFARGTSELGNVGNLVGPPFFQALAEKLPGKEASLAVQGVDYPADIPGFMAGGDKDGSRKMADIVSGAMKKCPNTKVVMSGYSQGGQLVHNAAALLPAKTAAKVAAAVIFGDPNNGQPVQGVSAKRTKIICHGPDDVCNHGVIVGLPHTTYGIEDADAAADFVVAAVRS